MYTLPASITRARAIIVFRPPSQCRKYNKQTRRSVTVVNKRCVNKQTQRSYHFTCNTNARPSIIETLRDFRETYGKENVNAPAKAKREESPSPDQFFSADYQQKFSSESTPKPTNVYDAASDKFKKLDIEVKQQKAVSASNLRQSSRPKGVPEGAKKLLLHNVPSMVSERSIKEAFAAMTMEGITLEAYHASFIQTRYKQAYRTNAFVYLPKKHYELLMQQKYKPFGVIVEAQRCKISPASDFKKLIFLHIGDMTKIELDKLIRTVGLEDDIVDIYVAKTPPFAVVTFGLHSDASKVLDRLQNKIIDEFKQKSMTVRWATEREQQQTIDSFSKDYGDLEKKTVDQELRIRKLEADCRNKDKLITKHLHDLLKNPSMYNPEEFQLDAVIYRHIYGVLQVCNYDIDAAMFKLGESKAKLNRIITGLQQKGYSFGEYSIKKNAKKVSRRPGARGAGRKKTLLADQIPTQHKVISDPDTDSKKMLNSDLPSSSPYLPPGSSQPPDIEKTKIDVKPLSDKPENHSSATAAKQHQQFQAQI